jgi:spermidine synthase
VLGIKILKEEKSKFNGNLRVVKSFGLGTYIQAEGLTQSGGVVEGIWKQTLHRVKDKRQEVKNVLSLGLGGGTVAKLIRKFWPEAKITGVDIDPMIVELGQKYLGLDEVDVDIKIQDAAKPIPDKFDLVIVDLYRGDQFPKKFEDEKFLKSLTKNKLVVFNRLYYKDKKLLAEEFGKKLQKFFRNVEYFYPEANLMFLCSK